MSSLVIRDATERDVPAIVAMLADDDKGGLREDVSEVLNPGYAAAFAAINADPNHHLLVAERGGILIGTFQLSFLPGLSHRGAWRSQRVVSGNSCSSGMLGPIHRRLILLPRPGPCFGMNCVIEATRRETTSSSDGVKVWTVGF